MVLDPSRNTEMPSSEDADVETSSNDYARRFGGEVGSFFLEVQTTITRELLLPWPKARVLDVGGGHGQITGPLVRDGHAVTVYGSREVCGERVKEWVLQGQASFRSGDLLKLPWPDETFDVVLSYRLLPHVLQWSALLGELCRVTRSGLLVDYPARRSANAMAGWTFGWKKRVEGNTRRFKVFSDSEIRAPILARGFRVTARRAEFLFPMALHRLLGSAAVSRNLEQLSAASGLTHVFGSPVILRAERG